MTREQIQEVIDKGGWILSIAGFFLKPIEIDGDKFYIDIYPKSEGYKPYEIECAVRELTKEEVEKYRK